MTIENSDYEHIEVDEVDRVVAALEMLSTTVESETIKSIIESFAAEIHFLVHEDDETD